MTWRLMSWRKKHHVIPPLMPQFSTSASTCVSAWIKHEIISTLWSLYSRKKCLYTHVKNVFTSRRTPGHSVMTLVAFQEKWDFIFISYFLCLYAWGDTEACDRIQMEFGNEFPLKGKKTLLLQTFDSGPCWLWRTRPLASKNLTSYSVHPFVLPDHLVELSLSLWGFPEAQSLRASHVLYEWFEYLCRLFTLVEGWVHRVYNVPDRNGRRTLNGLISCLVCQCFFIPHPPCCPPKDGEDHVYSQAEFLPSQFHDDVLLLLLFFFFSRFYLNSS